ncbi:MAG: hypothetical protein WBQ08_09520 [Candidatus Sulfotelmatobacter sp.]
MVSRVATALLSLGLAAGCEQGVGQSAASNSLRATDAEVCEIARTPQQFDGKLLRLHAYVSRGFEDSTLHDAACPEEALVNMGDPGGWPTEIWAEFADHTDYWGVKGFAPLVADERLEQFRTLLLERNRVHQMTAATMLGTFYAGKAAQAKDYKAPPLRGYGHIGCCSLFVISRIESVDAHYSSDLNYSSGDWSVDMPQGCYSEQMLSLPRNGTIRSWQRDADEGRDDWHYDPRRTAEDELKKLRSGALGLRTGGTTELIMPKKSKLKSPIDQPPTEQLTEMPSTPYLKRYEWLEPDRVTRFVVVVSRPYWLSESAASADRVIWAPVGASVLQCAAPKR